MNIHLKNGGNHYAVFQYQLSLSLFAGAAGVLRGAQELAQPRAAGGQPAILLCGRAGVCPAADFFQPVRLLPQPVY